MSLQEARHKMAEFNLNFKARMEAQRKQESASIQAEIDREVYALFDLGWSVSKIAKEYGTSDWATIKKILDRRVVLPTAASGEPVVTKDGAVYTLTMNGETVEFDVNEDYPWFHNGSGKSLLANKIRDDEEFLTKIVNSVA